MNTTAPQVPETVDPKNVSKFILIQDSSYFLIDIIHD